MTQRIDLSPSNEGIQAMRVADGWTSKKLDPKLLALVKTRASQINGCTFCLHMHSEEALKHGESPARLILLDAWHESALFSARERAALAWTESLTRIAETHAPDDIFAEVRQHFEQEEIAALFIAIAHTKTNKQQTNNTQTQHPTKKQKTA